MTYFGSLYRPMPQLNLASLPLVMTELTRVFQDGDECATPVSSLVAGSQPLDSTLTAISALTGTGIIVRTGSGNADAATRTIAAGTGLSVANGDGVAGNPTMSFSTAAVGTWAATPSSANLALAMTDETGSGSLVFALSPTLVTPTADTYTATTGYNISTDVLLRRRAAAGLQLGAADAATAVAQTLSVQSVVTGTTDVAGQGWIFAGSQGTGTGAGGNFTFRTAPAGVSGKTPNALVDSFIVGVSGSAGNGVQVDANDTPTVKAIGGTNTFIQLSSRGSGSISLMTNNTAQEQVRILHTASVTRYVTLTGSNGANPTIGTSAGDLAITPNIVGGGSVTTAAPTAGTAAAWKLGVLVTAAVTPDTTRYVQLDVAGTLYKLIVST